jgi:hypothetical protein
MTHQEYTALALAAVCLVTNFLGAGFTIKRVYAKWAEQQSEQLAYPADDIDEGAKQRRYGWTSRLVDGFLDSLAYFSFWLFRFYISIRTARRHRQRHGEPDAVPLGDEKFSKPEHGTRHRRNS